MKQKRNKSWVGALLLPAAVILLWGSKVTAGAMELPEELTETTAETAGVFVKVTEDTPGFEKADTDSKVILELTGGQELYMSVRLDGGWCQVMENGQAVYVQEQFIQELPAAETLMKEMQELEAARTIQAEQDVKARKEALRGRIIGIVIAVLIAGIFIAGIVGVMKSGDGEKADLDSCLDPTRIGK